MIYLPSGHSRTATSAAWHGARAAAIPAASPRSVSLRGAAAAVESGGETPPEPAGEDACGTISPGERAYYARMWAMATFMMCFSDSFQLPLSWLGLDFLVSHAGSESNNYFGPMIRTKF